MPKKLTKVETVSVESNSNPNSKENQMVETESKNIVRFVDSDFVPGAIECVIFTPANYNEKYVKVDLFDAISALNAIREFTGEVVMRVAEGVHTHNPARSKYDGFKRLYVGNNQVRYAIENGDQEMNLRFDGEMVNIRLPKTTKFVGEWAMVNLKTRFSGYVMPAEDDFHAKNITMKHEYLERLFSGTKLVIFTRPSLVKGELWNRADQIAKRLRDEMLDTDGAFKSPEEIMAPQYERMNERQDDTKLDRQTEVMKELAPVLQIPVVTTVLVDSVPMDVTAVPQGKYIVKNKAGFIKYNQINVINNLDSVSRLTTVATNGWTLHKV